MHQNPLPSIFRLPPEIRFKIFSYCTVWCTNTALTGRILIHVCTDNSVRWGKSGPKDFASIINTNLMRVNKQIGREAQRLCYIGNHFFFGGPKHALAFLTPGLLGQMSFDSIRHVHFDITVRVVVGDEPGTKCMPDWKQLCGVIGTLTNPEVFIMLWDTFYYGDDDKKTLLQWNEEHEWAKEVLKWRNLHSLLLHVNAKPVPETVNKRVCTPRKG